MMDKSNIEAMILLYAADNAKVQQDGVIYECAPARVPKKCAYILLAVTRDGDMSIHRNEQGIVEFGALVLARRAASRLNRDHEQCFIPVEMVSATLASDYANTPPVFTDARPYDGQVANID